MLNSHELDGKYGILRNYMVGRERDWKFIINLQEIFGVIILYIIMRYVGLRKWRILFFNTKLWRTVYDKIAKWCLNGKDNVDYALMLPLDPESHDSIPFVEIYFLILDMWKKTLLLFPFVNVKFVCLAFLYEWWFFLWNCLTGCVCQFTLEDTVREGVVSSTPPKQLQTLAQPFQLQHLFPPLAHRAEKDVASRSSQVDEAFDKTSVLYWEKFLNKKN